MTKYDSRYVEFRKSMGGYYYNPPKDALAAGIFEGMVRSLGSNQIDAHKQADRYNKILDSWREQGKKVRRSAGTVHVNSFEALCRRYFNSHFFKRLERETQNQYEGCLKLLCGTEIKDGKKTKLFGELLLISLEREHVYEAYEVISRTRGPSAANLTVRLLHRVLFLASVEWTRKFGISQNVAEKLDIEATPSREEVWDLPWLDLFIEKSTEMDMASLGLIAWTCFELMQRHKDVRVLKKTSFRMTDDGPEVWFTQTKRGQKIWIPVPEKLAEAMRMSMKGQTSHYVFPSELTGLPWQRNTFAVKARKVMKAAGIPDHIQARDLRRTAATEGGDSGMTEDELMAQGGWKSRASVSPYVQKTRSAAAHGQEKRRKYRNRGQS